ncbi:A24 family peptidase [Consotaella aegiceratis]|uniref:A24 family peptidase n=1 Tax=Consotaella aegiceratis TaxID=3097961 RepID=UPI002F406F3F
MTMAVVLILLFPLAMIASAGTDILSMTIPNWLTGLLAVVFFAAALAQGMAPMAVGLHAATGLICLAITFACFILGWMGGGDAKLIAATALWLGPTQALADYVVAAALFGGLLALGLLGARALVSPTTGVAFLDRLLIRGGGVPYGVALGAAGLMVFPDSHWGPTAFGFFA